VFHSVLHKGIKATIGGRTASTYILRRDPLQTFYWDLYKHQMSSWLKAEDKPPAARVAAASLGTAPIGVFSTRGSGELC